VREPVIDKGSRTHMTTLASICIVKISRLVKHRASPHNSNMGNSKRATTASDGQQNRKRRRRNVRTAEISSSSESSDSESSTSESEEVAKPKTRRNQSAAADAEVEMRVCFVLLKRNHREWNSNNAGL
jgi:uncharacterized membrane protein YhiD involved in acid resistance